MTSLIEDRSKELLEKLTTGLDFSIPNVDFDNKAFKIPDSLLDALQKVPEPLTIGLLTERKIDGDGAFDAVMTALKSHLKLEYDEGRITGAEYSKAYIAMLQSALQFAVQYLISRDNAYYQALGAQTQALISSINVYKAKVELAIAQAQAHQNKAEYANRVLGLGAVEKQTLLTNAQTSKTTEEVKLVTSQTARTEQDTKLTEANTSKVGKESLLVEAQTSQTAENTKLVTANTLKVGKEALLIEAQTAQTEENTKLTTANIAKTEEETKLVTANTLKAGKEALLIEAQTAQTEENTKLTTANIAKTEEETKLVTANTLKAGKEALLIEAQTAQTEENTKLTTANIAKTEEETKLVTANTLKAGKEALHIEAQTALTEANKNKVTEEVKLVTSQTTKVTKEIPMVEAQTEQIKKNTDLAIANTAKVKEETRLVGTQILVQTQQEKLLKEQTEQIHAQTSDTKTDGSTEVTGLMGVQKDVNIKQGNLIVAQTDVQKQQKELLREQTEQAHAQVSDTQLDGKTPVTGYTGNQNSLLKQQVTSFKKDAIIKAAKVYADSLTTQLSMNTATVAGTGLDAAGIGKAIGKLASSMDGQ